MSGHLTSTLLLAAAAGAFAVSSLTLARTAQAQATAPAALEKPLWKELTRPQQLALDPLASEWDAMDGGRKAKWLEIANRYSSMKPDEQQRVHERMRDWLKLTPEARRLARENYTLTKQLGKSDKTAQWEQYQQLPEEEKRKLAAEAASRKQVTNLPPKTQPKAVAPINPAPPASNGNK